MQTFVTVVVILAVIAFGVLLIRLLNLQHSERIAAFHYGRSGMPVPGPDPVGSTEGPRPGEGRAAPQAAATLVRTGPTGRADRTDGSRPN